MVVRPPGPAEADSPAIMAQAASPPARAARGVPPVAGILRVTMTLLLSHSICYVMTTFCDLLAIAGAAIAGPAIAGPAITGAVCWPRPGARPGALPPAACPGRA